MMRPVLPAAILALAAALPGQSGAQDLDYFGYVGLDVATSEGTDAEATLSFALGAEAGGFRFGVETESLADDPVDDFEYSFSVGYGFELGDDADFAVTYTRTFLNQSGYDSQELSLALGFPIGETVSSRLEAVYDLDADTTDVSAGLAFGFGDDWTASLLLGNDGTDTYGEFGLDYEVTEQVTVGFLAEVAESSDTVYTLSLTYFFGN